jgi:hypothetical protein
MFAAQAVDAALRVHGDGVRSVAQGWAGYMTLGRALARQPMDPRLRQAYQRFAEESGLTPPRIPLEGVALAPVDEEDAAALGAGVGELAGILGALAIAVDPDRLDASMALLEPVFGDTEIDVAVVPTEDPHSLFTRGRVVLARWESELVAEAEGAGMPVHPYGMPDPFAERPDAERWQTLDPDLCLP